MAFIVNVLGDKILQIGNEDVGRKFFFGNYWTKIRVAMRYTIPSVYGNILNPFFCMGISNGTDYLYTSSLCTDWLGLRIGNITPPQNRFTGNTSYTTYTGPNFVFDLARKVQENVSTQPSGMSLGNYWAGTTSYAAECFVDFVRVDSTTYNIIGHFAGTISLVQTYLSRSAYILDLEKESGTYTTLNNSRTFSNFSAGSTYDCVALTWNHSLPTWHILDLNVVRFM